MRKIESTMTEKKEEDKTQEDMLLPNLEISKMESQSEKESLFDEIKQDNIDKLIADFEVEKLAFEDVKDVK